VIKKIMLRDPKLIIPAAILAFLFLFPLLRPSIYFLTLLIIVFVYIALSESWNLLGGYAGYLSLGHVGFFGIGAYTTALLLVHFGLSPFLTAPIGGAFAAIAAAIVGYPTLRLRGPYFCIATLCFGLAMKVVASNVGFTGGVTGLYLSLPAVDIFTNRIIFYEVMLVLALVTVLIARWLEGTKLGSGLKAIREDEETAQTLGVNATRLKMTAFMLSAFLVGVVGGIYAYYLSYVHPEIVFDIYISIIIALMALLGGSRWWLGPLIGATILIIVDQMLMAYLPVTGAPSRIVFGLLLIFVIMFMPDGILSFIKRSRGPKLWH
jgi:branched-chain amino acid transport system permease protein